MTNLSKYGKIRLAVNAPNPVDILMFTNFRKRLDLIVVKSFLSPQLDPAQLHLNATKIKTVMNGASGDDGFFGCVDSII